MKLIKFLSIISLSKGNLYLIENSDAIGLSNIEDYKKYKDNLIKFWIDTFTC